MLYGCELKPGGRMLHDVIGAAAGLNMVCPWMFSKTLPLFPIVAWQVPRHHQSQKQHTFKRNVKGSDTIPGAWPINP